MNKKFDWLGRFDNVINSGGIKLHAEVIEEKLAKVIKNRFFVAGIPDEKLGEMLVLLIESVVKIENETFLKSKLFEEIKFEDHPDFTFEPTNLKDAKEVQITCNNTGSEVQLKIEGDGETVGAINIFYPPPKEVKVRWIIVNFNEGDKEKILSKINNKSILEKYFKEAFNPALIDVKIINVRKETLD